jgi:hypothetical protein
MAKYKIAYAFYELAKIILNQNNDIDNYLFVNADVYKYKIYYELTIISCYVGLTNINDSVIIVLNESSDESMNNNLLSNMKFYKDILQQKCTLLYDNAVLINVNGERTIFYSSSSCLLKKKDQKGYFMNVRYVNYLINNEGYYLNCDKHIISYNLLLELNTNLEPVKEKLFNTYYEPRKYIGIEDVRIYYDINPNNSDKILFTGTGFHKNDKIGIVMGKYDVNFNDNAKITDNNIDTNTLVGYEYLHSSNNSSCEKNWVYVEYNNSLHVVYKWSPLEICQINNKQKTINLVESKNMPKIFSYARGSTCGFKFNVTDVSGQNVRTEIWFIVHIVSYEQPRHYYHMLVIFDKNLNLLRYSAPFKFQGEPIEYCLSVIVEDDRVLIYYSTWDRTTKIGVYDKSYIDSITKYTP